MVMLFHRGDNCQVARGHTALESYGNKDSWRPGAPVGMPCNPCRVLHHVIPALDAQVLVATAVPGEALQVPISVGLVQPWLSTGEVAASSGLMLAQHVAPYGHNSGFTTMIWATSPGTPVDKHCCCTRCIHTVRMSLNRGGSWHWLGLDLTS